MILRWLPPLRDRKLNRAEFYKKHPLKVEKKVKGFQNVPRIFAAANPLADYCKKFPNIKPNIVLSGATGTGKTYSAQIIANNLLDRDFNVHFTTSFAMVRAFQKYAQSFGRDEDAIDTFLDCDLLIIDDLGAEPTIKNVTQEHIYNIINERLIQNRPFIITTNLNPAGLLQKYDQRIASRILSAGTSTLIEFKSRDQRVKK